MEKNKQLVADLEEAKENKDNLDSKVNFVMQFLAVMECPKYFPR